MKQTKSTELIYSIGQSRSLIDMAALRVRKKIYAILEQSVDLHGLDSILDVGVTADRSCLSSNYFENAYPHKERITALSDQPAHWLEDVYPGLQFVQGDGCCLPFPDASFDLVYSSAVWEHVGSRERQLRFLQECLRVARHYVFIATPNRWHPLEFHTAMPFIHWLPDTFCSAYLKWLNYSSMVAEGTLNLLTKKNILQMLDAAGVQGCAIYSTKFVGFTSNLLVFIDKPSLPTHEIL